MRINFNLLTSTSDWPPWLDQLQEEFLNYYHIDPRADTAKAMLWSDQGCRIFVEWCKKRNYDVAYWELDYTISKADPKMPIAYGIDINEACSYIVEYRLKVDHDS